MVDAIDPPGELDRLPHRRRMLVVTRRSGDHSVSRISQPFLLALSPVATRQRHGGAGHELFELQLHGRQAAGRAVDLARQASPTCPSRNCSSLSPHRAHRASRSFSSEALQDLVRQASEAASGVQLPSPIVVAPAIFSSATCFEVVLVGRGEVARSNAVTRDRLDLAGCSSARQLTRAHAPGEPCTRDALPGPEPDVGTASPAAGTSDSDRSGRRCGWAAGAPRPDVPAPTDEGHFSSLDCSRSSVA